ncbi:MAG: TlpA family protein disulfide reductase [Flavobacteriales bacterium]|nr:TlpA family protein disulfide reductase [Flavobacteriales bacterium]
MYKLLALIFPYILYSQFTIDAEIFGYEGEVSLRTYDGLEKLYETKKVDKNKVQFAVKEFYEGRVYLEFYSGKESVEIFSENEDVSLKVNFKDNEIEKVTYLNSPINNANEKIKEYLFKQDSIYRVVNELDNFSDAKQRQEKLNQELLKLSSDIDLTSSFNFPILNDYYLVQDKFINQLPGDNIIAIEKYLQDVRSYFANTGARVETFGLMRKILTNYLKISGFGANSREQAMQKMKQSVDLLLEDVGKETERGQLIQLAIINIANTYGVNEIADYYYNDASSMKCDVISPLKEKLDILESLKIGKVFPDTQFTKHVINTNKKSIHKVDSENKLILIWSSECPHCRKEIDYIKANYDKFKSKNIQIIGLSLDTDIDKFKSVADNVPWINDTELKYWDSSYITKYNVQSTPTTYLLDKDNKISMINVKMTELFNALK